MILKSCFNLRLQQRRGSTLSFTISRSSQGALQCTPGQKKLFRADRDSFKRYNSPGWPGISEQDYLLALHNDRFASARRTCVKVKKPKNFYHDLESAETKYGPTFQNLVDIRCGDKKAYCVAKILDTAAVMPHQTEYEHVIHPALLDSLNQMILPALTKPREPIEQALVGPSFENIYIASTISTQPGEELEGYSTTKWLDSRTAVRSVFVAESNRSVSKSSSRICVALLRCLIRMTAHSQRQTPLAYVNLLVSSCGKWTLICLLATLS